MKVDELIGTKLKMLTILKRLPNRVDKSGKSHIMVEAECECGNIKPHYLNNITNGKTVSCGCFQKKRASETFSTHGLTNHPLFYVWRSMIDRCYCETNTQYKSYGFIGVQVCDEWRNDFKAYYDWCLSNGWVHGLEVDKDIKYKEKYKTETGKLYSPEFCSIVTTKTNCRNRKSNVFITHNGMTLCVAEWAEKINIKPDVIYARIRKGITNEELLLATH